MSSSEMSTRRKTALAMVEAYETLDVAKIMAFRTPECTFQALPRSMNRPEMNNKEYAAHLGQVVKALSNLKIVVEEVFEDAAENKVVLWARGTADTKVGPYVNEYILMIYLNESGDRVTRFCEFVDSAFVAGFFPKLHQALGAKGGPPSA
ncbi:hypothetical protein B0H66DRAFT_598986 [Apodospora peruviana]|uniref:SnoaL-like domain-containing protein n=1 Tax=Apodospora peruviana TaxID=516989 RepID=A0AAE0MHS6_9PEZI|nr:hypothetical protein B0H66DRAFT_598986 [Apodospora peruviana]